MVEEDVDVPSIVEELLPPSHDRYVVLRQFLDTVATASAQSPTVWSATLLTKKPGFKINVGGVEVFWFTAGLLHMNLLGEPPSELHDSGSIMAAKYASVPQPQYHFFGDVSMFEQMRGILQPLHEAFVDLACYTPSGNLFKASKFARFHCKELVDYARHYVDTYPANEEHCSETLWQDRYMAKQEIANGDLVLAEIPSEIAPWRTVTWFALSIDGYAAAQELTCASRNDDGEGGGTEAAFDIARQVEEQFKRDGTLNGIPLLNLRIALFIHQRSCRWNDCEPDYRYVRCLIGAIRDSVARAN